MPEDKTVLTAFLFWLQEVKAVWDEEDLQLGRSTVWGFLHLDSVCSLKV